jgi:hypothetical protein
MLFTMNSDGRETKAAIFYMKRTYKFPVKMGEGWGGEA